MKRFITLFLAVVMTFSLTACSLAPTQSTKEQVNSETTIIHSSEEQTDSEENTIHSSEEAIENEEITFPVTIVDQAGRSLTIENKPEAIVSGYYISSSILIALGLKDNLVGIEAKAAKRPIYSLAAPELIDLPNVGSAKEFDLEGCAALKPDLIILPKKLKDAASSLEELGLKVILVNPENTEDLKETITIIGAATGTTSEGNKLIAAIERMQSDLNDMIANTASPSIYMASNSALLETASGKMYQSAMIENAGGINVAKDIDDTYWSTISYEQLLEWNPEYIIIAAEAEYTVDDILADTNLAECTAVKNGNVYAMPCDIEAWDSPVPGSILGSIWLANILHNTEVSTDYYEKSVNDFYETFYGFAK